jgi:hypothetical protein
MFNYVVLDVVIGLVFIYLLYSLLATIIQEFIATYLGLRAKMLMKGISRMLDDDVNAKGISDAFYGHPLIKYLGENKSYSKPAYLSAKNFSKVLIDLLRGENVQPGQSYNPLIQQALITGKTIWGVSSEISPQTLSYLRSLWADAQGDVEKFSSLLEQWFDDTMERASGWFKRKTQFILFFVGLALAIIFNIDTISIAGKLSNDPKLAAQLADNASVYMQNNKEILIQQFATPNSSVNTNNKVYKDQLDSIITKSNNLMNTANDLVKGNIKDSNKLLGLGWGNKPNNFHWWSILGWLITALAISLGAPFWFDLLNKLMQLRTSKKDGTTSTNAAEAKPQTIIVNPQTTSEEAVG